MITKHSGDYVFTASRRGTEVIIRGTVLAPPGSEPFLVRAYDARAQTRAFRLAYRNNSGAVPFAPQEIEPFHEAMATEVDTLKIHLPNEDVFVIKSDRRRGRGEKRGAPRLG